MKNNLKKSVSNTKPFSRHRLSQAIALACFSIAGTPAIAGGGACTDGVNTISGTVAGRCYLESGDSLEVTPTGIIDSSSSSDIGVYVYDATSISNAGTIDAAYQGIYFYASTVAGSVTNSGLIEADYNGIYVYGANTITGDFVNSGTILTDYNGIYLYGHGQTSLNILGNFVNSGLIDATAEGSGIYVYGDNSMFVGGDFTNSGTVLADDWGFYLHNTSIGGDLINSGTIDSGWTGIYLYEGSVGGSITNSGLIDAGGRGIYVGDSTIGGSITNSGTILSGDTGIYVGESTVGGDITNSGSIIADEAGIYVYSSVVIGNVINSGYLESTGYHGIYLAKSSIGGDLVNSGTIDANYHGIYVYSGSLIGGDLINSGLIIAGDRGIYVQEATVAGNLINSGTIDAADGGIYVAESSIGGDLINSGTITSLDYHGVYVADSSIGGDLVNSGIIDANYDGIYIYYGSSVGGDINNSGTIIAGSHGIYVNDATIAGSIINSGVIDADYRGIYLYAGTIVGGDVVNSGAITAGGDGIYLYENSLVAGSIINSGTITADDAGIYVYGSVGGDIINSGVIDAGYAGIYVYGSGASVGGDINNSGTIIADQQEGIFVKYATVGGTIINSGTITALGTYDAILLSSGGDYTIDNSGLVDGTIDLRDNTLNLSGTSGRITGIVTGTAGSVVNVTGTFSPENSFDGLDSFNIASGGTLFLKNGFNLTTAAVNNAGTLKVGAGSSETITTDYTQTGAGLYQTVIDSTTSYGQVTIAGTADLSANDALSVLLTGGVASGDVFADVLTATTLTTGGALTVEDNSFLLGFTAVEDGNTIDLTANVENSVADILAASEYPSAEGVGTAIDALISSGGAGASADMGDVLDELVLMDNAQEISEAVAQMVPAIDGGVSTITNQAIRGLSVAIRHRAGLNQGLSSGGQQFKDQNFWVKGYTTDIDHDNRKGFRGYDGDSTGLALGADAEVAANWRAGVAFAYTDSDFDSNLKLAKQSIDAETWQAGVYSAFDYDEATSLYLQAVFGTSDYDSTRNITFGSINRTASADYDSWHVRLNAELSRAYKMSGQLTLLPRVFAEYAYVDVDSYTESGAGALNLAVKSDDEDDFIIGIGVQADYAHTAKTTFTGNFDLAHSSADNSGVSSTLVGGGPVFVTDGVEPGSTVYRAGIGVEHVTDKNLEFYVRYDYQGRTDYDDQSLSANVRWKF